MLRHREQCVFTGEVTVLFICSAPFRPLLPAVDKIQAGFLLGRRVGACLHSQQLGSRLFTLAHGHVRVIPHTHTHVGLVVCV